VLYSSDPSATGTWYNQRPTLTPPTPVSHLLPTWNRELHVLEDDLVTIYDLPKIDFFVVPSTACIKYSTSPFSVPLHCCLTSRYKQGHTILVTALLKINEDTLTQLISHCYKDK